MASFKGDAEYLASVSVFAGNILKAERASRRTLSKDERARALRWYWIERARIEGVAWDVRDDRRLDARALTGETAIAAAATLSPATSWHALVVDLPGFLSSALDGDPAPPFATYGAQRVKAARIVREGLGIQSVTGPKVSAFARALNGDPSAVVVDRHAARIALADDTIVGVPKGLGDRIRAAYTLAAGRAGIEPAALQALVWVARVGFGGELAPTEGKQ